MGLIKWLLDDEKQKKAEEEAQSDDLGLIITLFPLGLILLVLLAAVAPYIK